MKKKRFAALLLCAALLFTGCSGPLGDSPIGVNSAQAPEKKTKVPARDTISMVFYEDMDCNPLTAANRENHELLKLICQPLVRIGADLRPEYVLAEQIVKSGKTLTVTLKAGAVFSDGSPVTAADVEAGMDLIRKTPASPYYHRMDRMKSWYATGDRTLEIRLTEEDVDIVSVLDIPVCKRGTALGSGPYQFAVRNGKTVLVPNEQNSGLPAVKTIELRAPKDAEEKKNMFAVGLLDVYFEPAEANAVFNSGRDYRVQTYPSDDLMFLGVNCAAEGLNTPVLRRFFSRMANREKLAEGTLLGQAEPAAYPFQPGWEKAGGLEQNPVLSTAELKTAAAELGFTQSENMLLNAAGKQWVFSLLVNAGNAVQRQVAEALAENYALYGVKLQVTPVAAAELKARLAAGNYQLYLGEIKTGRTLNTALFAPGSAVNYSRADFSALTAAAAEYRADKKTLKEFAAAFDEATPVFPLVYREGVLIAAADLGDFTQTGAWAVYGDISKLITMETETTT